MEDRYSSQLLGEKHLPLRGAFSSGEGALDHYLRERARKELEQRVAAVWVLHDSLENKLAGYYTLSAITVQREDLPPQFTHRMARYEIYPATLIGRLAVDQEYQGQRIGGRLLLDALARSLATSREVASVAVITDAKTPEAQSFYEHYGSMLLFTEKSDRRLFLPMRTIDKLFV